MTTASKHGNRFPAPFEQIYKDNGKKANRISDETPI